MNRSKGPGSFLKGLIPVLETVQTRLVLKRPQRALNRRTLDRYHRASEGPVIRGITDSWSQRALAWSQKDLEPVLEGPGHGLRRSWSCF